MVKITNRDGVDVESPLDTGDPMHEMSPLNREESSSDALVHLVEQLEGWGYYRTSIAGDACSKERLVIVKEAMHGGHWAIIYEGSPDELRLLNRMAEFFFHATNNGADINDLWREPQSIPSRKHRPSHGGYPALVAA